MLWKEIAKLELLSGSTRIALIEPNRFLNREEPNRRGTDTTRTALRFFFTFLKPNEPKRTAGSLHLCQCQTNIVYTTIVKGQRQHAGQVMYNEVMHAWVSGIFLGGWIEALHWVHASADRGLLMSWFVMV